MNRPRILHMEKVYKNIQLFLKYEKGVQHLLEQIYILCKTSYLYTFLICKIRGLIMKHLRKNNICRLMVLKLRVFKY